MPLQALELRSARSTSSTLLTAPQRLHDMGIHFHQPSQDAEAEEDLFDIPPAAAAAALNPQPDIVMED